MSDVELLKTQTATKKQKTHSAFTRCPKTWTRQKSKTQYSVSTLVPGCTFIVLEMSAYCLFVVSALSLLMILFVFFPLLCCHLDSFGSQGSALVYFPYSTAGLGLDEANTIQNQISTKNQARCCRICRVDRTLGLQTKVHHEDFTITEKAPKSDYYSASTFKI